MIKILIKNKEVLRIKDASKELNMTVQALYISIKKEKIRYVKHAGTLYVYKEDLGKMKKYLRSKKS